MKKKLAKRGGGAIFMAQNLFCIEASYFNTPLLKGDSHDGCSCSTETKPRIGHGSIIVRPRGL